MTSNSKDRLLKDTLLDEHQHRLDDKRSDPDSLNPGQAVHGRLTVSELLNTICHDVRATLAVTAGSAAELSAPECGPLSEIQRQLVGIIQRGNMRLTRLANNLMYLSEVWDGRPETRSTSINLCTFLEQALSDLQRVDSSIRCG